MHTVILAGENCINYACEAERFILALTDYIVKSPSDMRNVLFSNVWKTFTTYDYDVPEQAVIDAIEFKRFDEDICWFVNKGLLRPVFDSLEWYQVCLSIRQREKIQIVESLQEEVKHLQQSVIAFNVSDTNSYPSEYGLSDRGKIAVMARYGLLHVIFEHCKVQETVNFTKAAQMIKSFSGIHEETIRTCIMQILNKDTGHKNHPLKSKKNAEQIRELEVLFNLKKEQ